MENEDVIKQYLERYYTREWQNERICKICDRPIKDSVLEHFKKNHKNVYDDLMNEVNYIKKVIENIEKKP